MIRVPKGAGVIKMDSALVVERRCDRLEGLRSLVMRSSHLPQRDWAALLYGPQQHAVQGMAGVPMDPDHPHLPLTIIPSRVSASAAYRTATPRRSSTSCRASRSSLVES